MDAPRKSIIDKGLAHDSIYLRQLAQKEREAERKANTPDALYIKAVLGVGSAFFVAVGTAIGLMLGGGN